MRLRWAIAAATVYVISLVFLYLVTYGIAWAQGVTPNPASDVWSLLITQGPIVVVLAFGLWRTDLERRQLQTERAALLERTLKALSDTNTSVQSMVAAIASNNQLLTALNTTLELLAERVNNWHKIKDD